MSQGGADAGSGQIKRPAGGLRGWKMDKENAFSQREREVREACEHFGITKEESENGIWVSNNDEETRLRNGNGIDRFIYSLGEKGLAIKKARIITYYEAGYPLIIQTIIFE